MTTAFLSEFSGTSVAFAVGLAKVVGLEGLPRHAMHTSAWSLLLLASRGIPVRKGREGLAKEVARREEGARGREKHDRARVLCCGGIACECNCCIRPFPLVQPRRLLQPSQGSSVPASRMIRVLRPSSPISTIGNCPRRFLGHANGVFCICLCHCFCPAT